MVSFSQLLQQGAGNASLFVPTAVLLGALHGLEPGHSKTMMAAFIIAIRGTLAQAVLLGLVATVSHTAVVWAVALAGLHFGAQWSNETSEPYFQMASAVLILGVAGWMFWRMRRDAHEAHHDRGHHHHDHDHDHGHGHGHDHAHDAAGLAAEYDDSHARAHAADIQRRFANRQATTGQIIMFGLTGGLVPCPASITVLLLCLQLKQFALGATLVLCFSIGLAATMVAVGAAAALSVRHVSARWSGFDAFARRAPYASVALITLLGLYTFWSGWSELATHAA
ncbi:MAG: nickel/cobalt efflux transporter [Beijerinckiaceae bacterium]